MQYLVAKKMFTLQCGPINLSDLLVQYSLEQNTHMRRIEKKLEEMNMLMKEIVRDRQMQFYNDSTPL